MIMARLKHSFWIVSASMTLAVFSSPTNAQKAGFASEDQPGEVVVAEEDGPALIVDGEAVVTVEDGSLEGWQSRTAVRQQRDGKTVFLRPTDSAFENPDRRMSLELKYFFPLSDPLDWTCGNFDHAARPAEGKTKLISGLISRRQADHELFSLSTDSQGVEIQWVDFHKLTGAKHAALLITGRPENTKSASKPDAKDSTAASDPLPPGEASLRVLRLTPAPRGWKVVRQLAMLPIDPDQLPGRWLPGCLMDTWDRPRGLGNKGMFVGRVIALLMKVDGRYAVDFHGEALHDDSHCRVWLTRDSDAWGAPIAIRFINLAIVKPDDSVRDVRVLAVLYETKDSRRTQIALDYPMCRTPMLEQMQRLAASFGQGKSGGGLSASRLLGENLLDELSRRLVDGRYH